MQKEPGALARVQELYEQRVGRAEALQQQGKKVIGFLCSFVPLEFMTALDMIPYRIMGNPRDPITEADDYIENNLCPYVRNTFDQAIKGKYKFLDGLVVAHACDTVQRIYGLWRYYFPTAYSHYLNVPHTTSPSSLKFFKEELSLMKESLEQFAGKEITEAKLREAIQLHNESRALVRDLYDLRKQDPPLISGVEIMKLLVVGMSIPVGEFNTLLRAVKEEVLARTTGGPQKQTARLMIYGCIMDYEGLVGLTEESEANVVTDDFCIGMRTYMLNVPNTPDPLDGLVQAYLVDFLCPRTDREPDVSRFDYLIDRAKEAKADGVIAYVLKFCDPHGFDVPDARDHMQQAGLPVLKLEDDYTISNIGQLKTRVQAFIETIASTQVVS